MASREIQTYCAMCVSRCGVVATVEDGRLTRVRADPQHPNGCICVKGAAAPAIVYAPERLPYPVRRTRPKGVADPGWERLDWDAALDLAATRLAAIRAQHGAEAVVFGFATPSGAATHDTARWLERLANAFGSPNVLTSLHVCNWNRSYGTQYTIGAGTPSPDYDNARCILLWGFNPQVSWPAAAKRIAQARQRGARVIVVDPRRSGAARQADCWLPVRPGADGALALAMIHVLIEERLYDEQFVREWTNGAFLVRADTGRLLTARDVAPDGARDSWLVWDERQQGLAAYRADTGYAAPDVRPALAGEYAVTMASGVTVTCRPAFALLAALATEYAPERSADCTWVPAEDVRRAVRLFVGERPSCYYTWVGLEQHTNTTQTVRAVSLFYALTGQLDCPGGNVEFATAPIRGVSGTELLPPGQAARRLGAGERPLGPARMPGHVAASDLYRAILAGEPYPVRALVCFGGDLLLANADPARGRAALEALDFYLQIDLVTNPSAAAADLLLPAATCWEREAIMPSFPTGEDTANWVQLRGAVVPPQHESRSDLEILFALAARLGLAEQLFGGSVEAAQRWQLAPAGITLEQLRAQPGGVRAPERTRYRKYAEHDPRTGRPRGFRTPSRLVEVYATPFAAAGYPPLPVYEEPAASPFSQPVLAREYPLLLTFARLVQFSNEQQRHIPPLRRQAPRPYLALHPTTAAAAGIADGDRVLVESPAGSVRLAARLDDTLHPRVVVTQYGWWQACSALELPGHDPCDPDGPNANRLVTDAQRDPISGTVPHRSQLCRVRKA